LVLRLTDRKLTQAEFTNYWNIAYPDSLPIGYELKHLFNDRWFRIQSLPESKRYADTPEEEQIILDRQNSLFTDLFGEQSEFHILAGLYTNDLSTEQYLEELDFDTYEHLMDIPLHQVRSEEYQDEPTFYQLFLKTERWSENKMDKLLLKIANDEIRLLFINIEQNCVILPYDGGVDVILKDQTTMEVYKQKYSAWLSDREDGM
jgi:hypothetical protein